jgi:hypothetical protein
MPDLVSRPYRPDPAHCCEACVFGRVKHTCGVATTGCSSRAQAGERDGHAPSPDPEQDTPPCGDGGKESATAGLRPIGTRFTVVWPPGEIETDERGVLATYEVVAHDRCRSGAGRELVERLECVGWEPITPP